jgi:heme-degrading monooxygenase HmoA
MHSRVTLLEIDTLRLDVGAAVRLFEQEVVPGLREQEGYAGALVLATPEGRGMVVSFWKTEEAAEKAAAFATAQLDRHVMLFASPPGRESYEVAYLDLAGVEAGRT